LIGTFCGAQFCSSLASLPGPRFHSGHIGDSIHLHSDTPSDCPDRRNYSSMSSAMVLGLSSRAYRLPSPICLTAFHQRYVARWLGSVLHGRLRLPHFDQWVRTQSSSTNEISFSVYRSLPFHKSAFLGFNTIVLFLPVFIIDSAKRCFFPRHSKFSVYSTASRLEPSGPLTRRATAVHGQGLRVPKPKDCLIHSCGPQPGSFQTR